MGGCLLIVQRALCVLLANCDGVSAAFFGFGASPFLPVVDNPGVFLLRSVEAGLLEVPDRLLGKIFETPNEGLEGCCSFGLADIDMRRLCPAAAGRGAVC